MSISAATKFTMKAIAQLITVALKLFVLGLIIRVVLSWVRSPQTRKVEVFLDKIYEPVLRPIRQVVKPLTLKASPQMSLDLSPFVLILIIWWLIHPLLMWVIS